uniref:Uncharacterized protein n=1 Tax=Anopheles merus TaxID=30066 RepID=A0A182UWS2_ANOME
MTRRSSKKKSSQAASSSANTATNATNDSTIAVCNDEMLTGTSVPYDPAAEHLAHCQDHDRVNTVNGNTASAATSSSTGAASASSGAGVPSSSMSLKHVPIKAIVFSDESLPSIDGGTASSHLRPATPSSLRPNASLTERCLKAAEEEEEKDCSLPSPPPPPSLQTVPVMQMQALHLHQPVPQYQQDLSHGTDRSCFSPPPTATVTTTTSLLHSSGAHAIPSGSSGASRQLPAYPPAVSLPKPTPIWVAAGVQHSAGGSSSVISSGALARERSVPVHGYSTASTIAVATGSNSPAVVSTVPILRTFGASAGSRQNSFGS